MHVHELKEKFLQRKNYSCEDVNELLDFVKRAYLFNEISSSEYKILVRELESQGAKIPQEENQDHFIIEN